MTPYLHNQEWSDRRPAGWPCAQPDVETDAKGRKKRHSRRYQTPLETLLFAPNHETFHRPGHC